MNCLADALRVSPSRQIRSGENISSDRIVKVSSQPLKKDDQAVAKNAKSENNKKKAHRAVSMGFYDEGRFRRDMNSLGDMSDESSEND
jgi:hypothetical protein